MDMIGLVEAAHRQAVLRWQWHELDEAIDETRYPNKGELMFNRIIADAISTEYAFLWN